MKNRAKCKLCSETIESFHRTDFVTCKCGEISVDGGDWYYKCSAKDWKNFLRVDDLGNEIVPEILQPNEKEITVEESPILTRQDKIEMLEAMVKNLENLPKNALDSPINHFDLYSHMLLVLEILKA